MAEYRKLANYSNYRIYPDGRILKKLYDELIEANVDNTVLNSRVKVLESV